MREPECANNPAYLNRRRTALVSEIRITRVEIERLAFDTMAYVRGHSQLAQL